MVRAALIFLITLYRRYLSGRGPLRGVRCSFAAHESCSAYGLRVAQRSPSTRIALARIGRRLRRCGDACLRSDGHVVSWTEQHDEAPSAIATQMRDDAELDASIALMLHTRRAVATWCADPIATRACDVELALAPPVRTRRPIVVKFNAMVRRAVERLRRRTIFAVVAIVALAVIPSWFDAALAALLVAGVALAARAVIRTSRRFELHTPYAARARAMITRMRSIDLVSRHDRARR